MRAYQNQINCDRNKYSKTKDTPRHTNKKRLTVGQPEWFVDQIKIKDTLSLFSEGH